ncbi:MAG TPA: hypothetical protein PKV45_04530 [Tenuifilum sp.]|nr:hypothetical protein [Paludibacteraceae bacterium]HQE54274.1 hypothetical protein [Tenuifilum sp.]
MSKYRLAKYKLLSVRGLKSGSFGFAEGSALCVGAKPNVPLAGWRKITRLFKLLFSGARESLRLFVFKKCGGEKNKKHRVGNEYWLTRCPFVVLFLCLCLPVKMVYFFIVFSRLFVVVGSSFTLAANGWGLVKCRSMKRFIVPRYEATKKR